MKGNEQKRPVARWIIPLIMVLPLAALAVLAISKWGGQIGDLFLVALKMAVVS